MIQDRSITFVRSNIEWPPSDVMWSIKLTVSGDATGKSYYGTVYSKMGEIKIVS